MQLADQEDKNLADKNWWSFNRFLAIVVVLMILTGGIAFWDTWAGDLVESTGPGETRQIELPERIKVWLDPESRIKFQKGSTHKIVLEGSALFQIGGNFPTRKVTVETSGIIVKTKYADFRIQGADSHSMIKVEQGKVQVISKTEENKMFDLAEGEEFSNGIK